MSRKRKRTAWHAVAESRPILYHPSQTSATYTESVVHIATTSERAGDITAVNVKSTRPSINHPEHNDESNTQLGASGGAAIPVTRHDAFQGDHIDNVRDADFQSDDGDANKAENDEKDTTNTPPHQSHPRTILTSSPTPSTPLIVTAADVSAARRELGLTPRTPSESTVFLDSGAAAAARALLSSTRRAGVHRDDRNQADCEMDSPSKSVTPTPPSSSCVPSAAPLSTVAAVSIRKSNADIIPVHPLITPVANRRLSSGSAVTPIALNFESSPLPPRSVPHPSFTTTPAHVPSAAINALPSPITPATDGMRLCTKADLPASNVVLNTALNGGNEESAMLPVSALAQKASLNAREKQSSLSTERALDSLNNRAMCVEATALPPSTDSHSLAAPVCNQLASLEIGNATSNQKKNEHKEKSLSCAGSGGTISSIPSGQPKYLAAPTPLSTTKKNCLSASSPGAVHTTEAVPLFSTGNDKPVASPSTPMSGVKHVLVSSTEKGVPLVPSSKAMNEAVTGPLFTTGKGVPLVPSSKAMNETAAGPLFTTGKGVPLVPSSKAMHETAAGPLFTTGKGVPLAPSSKAMNEAATGPLFTTGKGVPLVPSSKAMNEAASGPLFTTGKGVPLVPSSKAMNEAASGPLFTTGKGVPIVPSASALNTVADPMLIVTGKGISDAASHTPLNTRDVVGSPNMRKKTGQSGEHFCETDGDHDDDAPLLKIVPDRHSSLKRQTTHESVIHSDSTHSGVRVIRRASAAMSSPSTVRTPSSGVRLFTDIGKDGGALATTGSHGWSNSVGRALPSTSGSHRLPVKFLEPRGVLLNGLVTPTSKTPSTDVLRKTLFRDEGRSSRHNSARSSGIKSTPFKRPRVIARSLGVADNNNLEGSKLTGTRVPRFAVPMLRKSGRITCTGRGGHTCDIDSKHRSSPGSSNWPPHSMYASPGCLKTCATFEFEKDMYGPVDCLPGEVAVASSLWEREPFGLANCLSWVRNLFPLDVKKKPATNVGSDAWTTLSYALAVWKLCLLEALKQTGEFLTVTNVVRELLRRIQKEWHLARQPWLLRMLRRDTNPASHVVLRIVDIEPHENDARLVLTDGWYVARALLDSLLCKALFNGYMRIGDKIHVTGAVLHSGNNGMWFFGEADEIGDGTFKLHKNGVFCASKESKIHMGVHHMLDAKSLKWVREGAGPIAAATVVVLRRYPISYMEILSTKPSDESEEEGEGRSEIQWRREEAEEEALIQFQEQLCRKREDNTERKRRRLEKKFNFSKGYTEDEEDSKKASDLEIDDHFEHQNREVTSVLELLVCGIDDDASVKSARKFVRIYKASEDMELALRRDFCILHLMHLVPRKDGAWHCKGDGVWEAENRGGNNVKPQRNSKREQWIFPRQLVTVSDLKSGLVNRGEDFDGAFYVIYDDGHSEENAQKSRFIYLVDDSCQDSVAVLALQLCNADMKFIPRALRPAPNRNSFSVVGLRDAIFQNDNSELDIIHSQTTLRTSFLTTRGGTTTQSALRQRMAELELRLENAEVIAQLDILREAIMSFSSGKRLSIAAYFSTTQQSSDS